MADLFGSRPGHGTQAQVSTAHQVRDMRYAINAGGTNFAPAMLAFLQRAVHLGRKREQVKDSTMQRHRRELLKRLAAVLEPEPTQADGIRLRKRYLKVREQLLVFMSDREVPTTNNVSEQALCMSAVFRKVTNGFRVEWGAELHGGVRTVVARAASRDSRRWPRCARRWRVTASSHRRQHRAPNDQPLAAAHPLHRPDSGI